MNLPANTPESTSGRDADEYQWAEFNLPSDFVADECAASVAEPVLAMACCDALD